MKLACIRKVTVGEKRLLHILFPVFFHGDRISAPEP